MRGIVAIMELKQTSGIELSSWCLAVILDLDFVPYLRNTQSI